MTPRGGELRLFTWGALKAALLVVGVMCLGIVLFVLFCQLSGSSKQEKSRARRKEDEP